MITCIFEIENGKGLEKLKNLHGLHEIDREYGQRVIENLQTFTPHNIFLKRFKPLKFSIKYFRPLSKTWDRLSGRKDKQPLDLGRRN